MTLEIESQTLRQRRLNRARNRVRGALGKVNSSAFSEGGSLGARGLNRHLKSCLVHARSDLAINQYDEFLGWYERLKLFTYGEVFFKTDDFEFLSGFVAKAPKVSLQRELSWTAKYLALHSGVLSEFSSVIGQVERALLKDDFSAAQSVIEIVEEKYGQSFWSCQLQISIAQMSGGLEAQKRLISSLRGKHSRGVLSYVAYFTGVRNEDKTSWTHFKEMIESRIGKSSYPDDLRNYLRFRLLGEFPQQDLSAMTDILRHEQSSHPFDMYSTLLLVLQQLSVEEKDGVAIKSDVRNAVERLQVVDDFRIRRLCQLHGIEDLRAENDHSPTVLECLTRQDFGSDFRRAWRRTAKTGRPSAVEFMARSAVRAGRVSGQTPDKNLSSRLEGMLAALIVRDTPAASALEQWPKVCCNLSGLPFFDALRSCERLFGLIRSAPERASLLLAILNSENVGTEIKLLGKDYFEPSDTSINEDFVELFISEGAQTQDVSEASRKEAAVLAGALRSYFSNQHADAITACEAANSELVRSLLAPVYFFSLLAEGKKNELLVFAARRIAEKPADYLLLPLLDAVPRFTKADWKSARNSLSPLIFLHAAWRLSDSDKIAAMLRHELNAFLKSVGADRPTDLFSRADEYESAEFIYFLRYICRPAFMDLIRAFKTSKEVIVERRDIAGYLVELDEKRSEDYTAEVVQISSHLKIDEGLEMVESSRIHVDGDAFRRWASRRVKEDYERYSALVSAGLVAQSDVEEILRNLLSELSTRQAFYTPDDQADAILTSMYTELGRQFLANSDFGLDYYLSKRIRHQSFIGLIRGPLEFANLITTKESEFGSYRDNQFVRELLALPDHKDEDLQRVLKQFSERFDSSLISLKDEFLQIKSDDKPNGIFQIPISRRALFVTRTLAQAGMEFETFLNTTFQLFWQAMEPCLEEAKIKIGHVLKSDLVDLMVQLREDVRGLAEDTDRFAELSNQINDCSVEVQRMLDRAASWFERPDAQPKGGVYTLQEGVDIAIASALTMHRAFEPELEVSIRGNVELQPPDLLLLWETIFVGIDNVKAHSGIKSQAHIELKCEYENENLLVSITSALASKGLSRSAAEKLKTISERIDEGRYGQASKKEGGSGFLKLASVLKHTPGGRLNFGVIEDNKFELVVEFRPTKATVAILRVSDENPNR